MVGWKTSLHDLLSRRMWSMCESMDEYMPEKRPGAVKISGPDNNPCFHTAESTSLRDYDLQDLQHALVRWGHFRQGGTLIGWPSGTVQRDEPLRVVTSSVSSILMCAQISMLKTGHPPCLSARLDHRARDVVRFLLLTIGFLV
jgi:hypothetical protein